MKYIFNKKLSPASSDALQNCKVESSFCEALKKKVNTFLLLFFHNQAMYIKSPLGFSKGPSQSPWNSLDIFPLITVCFGSDCTFLTCFHFGQNIDACVCSADNAISLFRSIGNDFCNAGLIKFPSF